jgi:hypothetical protein
MRRQAIAVSKVLEERLDRVRIGLAIDGTTYSYCMRSLCLNRRLDTH